MSGASAYQQASADRMRDSETLSAAPLAADRAFQTLLGRVATEDRSGAAFVATSPG